jgi:Initiation factor 2 subunit family
MGKVDLVLVGSEAVVESGGLINAVGSYQIALIAKAANVPFYALAERLVPVREHSSRFSPFLAIATNSIGCSRYPSMTFRPIPMPYFLSLSRIPERYGPAQPKARLPLVTFYRILLQPYLSHPWLQITLYQERHIPP